MEQGRSFWVPLMRGTPPACSPPDCTHRWPGETRYPSSSAGLAEVY